MPKICALTMVYRNHWALGQWYRHFAAMLGPENLFIIAHGPDAEIANLCPGAQIWTVPRDRLNRFDIVRERMLNAYAAGLGEIYDWVIRTDADELICLDPALWGSLDALVSDARHALFALGLNLIEAETDSRLADRDSVFDKRRWAMLSGQYSKAWIGQKRTRLEFHGVRLPPKQAEDFTYSLPVGVYLVHLKYANLATLAADNAVRRDVVAAGKDKMPGYAWAYADKHTRTYLDRFAARPEADWTDAVSSARAHLITSHKRGQKGLIQSDWYDPDCKLRLPDWFQTLAPG